MNSVRVITLMLMILSGFEACYSQDESEFDPVALQTGQTPSCYEFREASDSRMDNFLKIIVGGDADVVLKLIRQSNDECIRYVFINKDDSYFIRNIPAGVYYVKIAFGNNWAVSKQQSACTAKFLENSFYQIGNDLLDFNPVDNYEGIQIPSYELILKTYSNNKLNEFNAEDITEEEFNK